MERNKIKPDTILKTFWRDSEHFADLFNAALFDGRQVLNKFCNPDVDTVFDVSRAIYARDYQKINRKYKDQAISTDLGLVIGAITESQQLIDHALELERKGGRVDMCNALEELRQEGVQEGIQKGIQEGIQKERLEGIRILVRAYKNMDITKDTVVEKLINDYSLSEKDAAEYVNMYW